MRNASISDFSVKETFPSSLPNMHALNIIFDIYRPNEFSCCDWLNCPVHHFHAYECNLEDPETLWYDFFLWIAALQCVGNEFMMMTARGWIDGYDLEYMYNKWTKKILKKNRKKECGASSLTSCLPTWSSLNTNVFQLLTIYFLLMKQAPATKKLSCPHS